MYSNIEYNQPNDDRQYQVRLTRRAAKNIYKIPRPIRKKLKRLIEEMELKGPVRGDWPNYSKLAPLIHHCHLAPRWVACWREIKDVMIIEVYYAGNRQDAPY